MRYVCDMKNFPNRKYFRQYELPSGKPQNYPYRYTRPFLIILDAAFEQKTNHLKKLNPKLEEVIYNRPQLTADPLPGVPADLRPWEKVVEDLLNVSYSRTTNPIDFELWAASRIILQLEGGFWRFSSTLAPLTTKHRYRRQYFDLRRHIVTPVGVKSLTEAEWKKPWSNYDCRSISFYTGEPCPDMSSNNNARHGFSLNLDLLHLDNNGNPDPDQILPITFDPDIENKGGHGI